MSNQFDASDYTLSVIRHPESSTGVHSREEPPSNPTMAFDRITEPSGRTIYPDTISLLDFNTHFRFHDAGIKSPEILAYALDPTCLVMSTALENLLSSFFFLTVKELRFVGGLHRVFNLKTPKEGIIIMLQCHSCSQNCSEVVYVFKSLGKPRTNAGVRVGTRTNRILRIQPNQINVVRNITMVEDVPPTPSTNISLDQQTMVTDPLRAVSDDDKIRFIKDWQSATQSDEAKIVVCAACSSKEISADTSWIRGSSVDLRLLRNDALPIHLRPQSYNFTAYQRAILNPKGLESLNVVGRIRLCSRCLKSLRAGRMPKFSLANWLYSARDRLPDEVKSAFEHSSLFERMLIARARCNSICCRFTGDYNTESVTPASRQVDILSRARKGIRGNVMATPLDNIKMHNYLPPTVQEFADTVCTLFVGDRKPTRASIARLGPVLVRKTRVKILSLFLIEHNEHYRSATFNEANLGGLYNGNAEADIPSGVHIGHLSLDDSLELMESDYTPRNDDSGFGANAYNEILMDNVGYTDGDHSSMAFNTMKLLALKHCLSGKPFLMSGSGSRPVQDFNNPSILTWLFPHIDPWGIIGFYHPERRINISMEEQLCHMVKSDDDVLARDSEFAFVFFNVVRKYNVARNLRFSVPKGLKTRIVTEVLNFQPEDLNELCKSFEQNPLFKPVNEVHKKMLKTLKSLNMVARNVPGSDGYKLQLRNQIRGLIFALGTPTLFITLNPSDVDHPIVRVFAGEDLDISDIFRGEDLGSWQRKIFAANNPSACARFFDFMVKNFIKVILRYGQREPGLFGHCSGYFGTVEAQGKGTLHCHMLVWLKGHLSPQEMHDNIRSSPEYGQRLYRWIDSIIMNQFPSITGSRKDDPERSVRIRARENGEPHPGTIPLPSFLTINNEDDSKARWREFLEHLTQLLYEYNWHEHTATCWKYLKRGQVKTDANCRLGMDGVLQPDTRYDPDTESIVIMRLHPKISSYNDVLTFILQCNSNIQFVGSGDAAKAFLYYVTDYITKPSLPMHVGLSALACATKKVRINNSGTTSDIVETASTRALMTVVNSMMGRQEISHQQVMSYLVGSGDHYTPFQFHTLHRWMFLNYISRFFRPDNVGVSTEDRLEESTQGGEEYIDLRISEGEVTENNQVLDYIFRPLTAEYEGLCLYEFISQRVKFRYREESSSPITEHLFSSTDHPQIDTHGMTFRKEPVIPVVIGPSIPTRGDPTEPNEVWARDILILLKPWRSPSQLKRIDGSWNDSYLAYKPLMTQERLSIVRNIQTSAECAAAKSHHPRRRHVLDMPGPQEGSNRDQEAQPLGFEENVDRAEEWTMQHARDIFRNLGDTDIAGDDLDSGGDVHVIDRSLHIMLGKDIVNLIEVCFPKIVHTLFQRAETDVHVYDDRNRDRISEHAGIMNLKRKRRIAVDDEDDVNESALQQRRRHVAPFVEITDLETLSSESLPHEISTARLVDHVIQDMSLYNNKEQCRAFEIVANHLTAGPAPQLLMYISGVGGTGKSHVIKSIVKLFERLGRRRELLLGAPTGIAAILIGGQTLHSLILTSASNQSRNIAALMDIWRHVKYLIIDEVSMIGATFLDLLSQRLRQAKGDNILDSQKPFGGVNIIFVGDIAQLKPPRQHALYARELVESPSFTEARNSEGISALNGAFIWRMVHKVVELKQNVRHAGDPKYSDFLSRLRVGSCLSKSRGANQDDYEYLRPRLMSEIFRRDPNELLNFADAPIIVGTKSLRDVLNARLIIHHAARLNVPVSVYYSRDFARRAPVPESTREYLWSIPSAENRDAFGRLPLFVGMKVMITENVAFNNKVVNGAEGVVRSIYFESGDDGNPYLSVVYVHIDGSKMFIPGLPPEVVPIFPVKVNIKKDGLNSLGINAASFTRLQVPLVPAYAYTDFKSQGRTLSRVIVDLVTARGQGVYVMLSRVTSLSGLAILRWFPPSRVFHRLPEELRKELKRLSDLSVL